MTISVIARTLIEVGGSASSNAVRKYRSPKKKRPLNVVNGRF